MFSWLNTTPIPEPAAYIAAQLRALLDPHSARDTMLVTPGSPVPSIPDGLVSIETHRGLCITSRPEKAALVDSEDDVVVGRALFGFGCEQLPGMGIVVQALDADGVPVAELVVPPWLLTDAILAASECLPEGGRLDMVEPPEAIMRRMVGVLDDQLKGDA